MKFTLKEIYVLAVIAQHWNDRASQKRLLGRLEGPALTAGKLIMGLGDATASDELRAFARRISAWVKLLGRKPEP